MKNKIKVLAILGMLVAPCFAHALTAEEAKAITSKSIRDDNFWRISEVETKIEFEAKLGNCKIIYFFNDEALFPYFRDNGFSVVKLFKSNSSNVYEISWCKE